MHDRGHQNGADDEGVNEDRGGYGEPDRLPVWELAVPRSDDLQRQHDGDGQRERQVHRACSRQPTVPIARCCVSAVSAGVCAGRHGGEPARSVQPQLMVSSMSIGGPRGRLGERETIGEAADLKDALHRLGAGNDQELNVQPLGAFDE